MKYKTVDNGEERIKSGDIVEYKGRVYFAKSKGSNIELRDDNVKFGGRGIKIKTVKREECKKVILYIGESEEIGLIRMRGRVRSEGIIGREIMEIGGGGGGGGEKRMDWRALKNWW